MIGRPAGGRPSPLDGTSSLRDEILLAELLYDLLAARAEIEPFSQVLGSAAFRFVPADLLPNLGEERVEAHLDRLNRKLGATLCAEWSESVVVVEIDGRVAVRIAAGDLPLLREQPRSMVDRTIALGRALDSRLRTTRRDPSLSEAD